MNVIISNRNRDILSNLKVEIIKTMSGEFTADEIISVFSSMFYNKMFLDISSIKNYSDIKEIQKLALNLDANKIVLLLENNEICSSSLFQSKLVNMGIYNFTSNLDGLNYLSMHTNAYRDVAHLQDVSNNVNNIVNDGNVPIENNISNKRFLFLVLKMLLLMLVLLL